MAIITIAFEFENEFHFISFTSDQFLAQVFDDSILDFKDKHPEFGFDCSFWSKGKKYLVELAYQNPYKLSIFEEEGDQYRVATDIPYLLIKVENEDNELLYDLANYV